MSTPSTRLALRLGVYHRHEAAALGLKRRKDGSFPGHRVLPRVWSLLPPPFRPEALRAAACLWAGPEGTVGGLHAGVVWGWHDSAPLTHVEVVVGLTSGLANTSFVRVHRTVAPCSMPTQGIRVTSGPRTIVRLGALLPGREFLAIFATALQRRSLIISQVQDLIDEHPCLPGAQATGQAIAVLRGGADSIREVDLVRAVIPMGLPVHRTQISIYVDGELLTVADLGWDGVLVFYDGRPHLSEERRQDDGMRRARVEALGFQVVVVTNGVLANPALLEAQLRSALTIAARQGDAVTRLPKPPALWVPGSPG